MKTEFLIKEPDNTRLILIVAGWGSGPAIAEGLNIKGWDVAVVHDYSDFSFDASALDGYYTIYLFAWSLGVYVASRFMDASNITAAYAINGTLNPVDDAEGIPPAIYDGTLAGLDARNLLKFRIRMTGDRTAATAFAEKAPGDVENLRQQLVNIRAHHHTHVAKDTEHLPWTRAFISQNDRIFTPENQQRAWERDPEVEIVELDAPHYVDIPSIVRMVIADPDVVSKRFKKASVSYDTHAIAQYSAAIKLAGHLANYTPLRTGKSLEIGCGTGLFTNEYARLLQLDHATFVDITETGPFGIAKSETYVVEDAEKWMERQTEKWDFILSASAIQWFADIPRFLHLCSQRLTEQGVLVISTFLPGNMEELDSVRPSPLRYPEANKLCEWLMRDFDDVRVIEDEIKVEFQSVRDMLMHLKHTGVAGSAPSSHLSLRDMTHLRTLTYRPVYLLARHP